MIRHTSYSLANMYAIQKMGPPPKNMFYMFTGLVQPDFSQQIGLYLWFCTTFPGPKWIRASPQLSWRPQAAPPSSSRRSSPSPGPREGKFEVAGEPQKAHDLSIEINSPQ